MDDRDFRFGGGKYYAKSIEFVYENRINIICLMNKNTSKLITFSNKKTGHRAGLFVSTSESMTSVSGFVLAAPFFEIVEGFSR